MRRADRTTPCAGRSDPMRPALRARVLVVLGACAVGAAAALLVRPRRDATPPAPPAGRDDSVADVDPDVMYAACDRTLFVTGSREEHELIAAHRDWIDRFCRRAACGTPASQTKALDYALMLLDNLANLTGDERAAWEEGRAAFDAVSARQGAAFRAGHALTSLLDLARDERAQGEAIEWLHAYVERVDDPEEHGIARVHLAERLFATGRAAEGRAELLRSRDAPGAAATLRRALEREAVSLAVGAEAPAIEGKLDSGASFTTAAFRDRWVWIETSARTCGPCRAERPAVESLATWLQERGVVVVSLCVRSAAGCPAGRRDGDRIHASVDAADATFDLLGLGRQPRNFVVGPDGTLRAKDLRGEALRARWEALLGPGK